MISKLRCVTLTFNLSWSRAPIRRLGFMKINTNSSPNTTNIPNLAQEDNLAPYRLPTEFKSTITNEPTPSKKFSSIHHTFTETDTHPSQNFLGMKLRRSIAKSRCFGHLINNSSQSNHLWEEITSSQRLDRDSLDLYAYMRHNKVGSHILNLPLETAETNKSLGKLLFDERKFDYSLDYYFKALNLANSRSGQLPLETASIYYHIGEIYDNQRKYLPALENYLQCVNFLEPLETKDTLLPRALRKVGNIYAELENFRMALEYYNKSNTFSSLLEFQEKAELYENIAWVHEKLTEPKQAYKFYKKALDLQTKLVDKNYDKIAKLYESIGFILKDLGKEDQALKSFEKMLSFTSSLNDPISRLNSLDLVGMQSLSMQKIYQAAKIYTEIEGLLKNKVTQTFDLKDHEQALLFIRILNNIVILKQRGQSEIGLEEFLEEMLEVVSQNEESLESPNLSMLWYNISSLYFLVQDHKNAFKYFEKGVEFERKEGKINKMQEIQAYERLAKYCLSNNNFVDGLKYVTILSDLYTEVFGKDHPESSKFSRLKYVVSQKVDNLSTVNDIN